MSNVEIIWWAACFIGILFLVFSDLLCLILLLFASGLFLVKFILFEDDFLNYMVRLVVAIVFGALAIRSKVGGAPVLSLYLFLSSMWIYGSSPDNLIFGGVLFAFVMPIIFIKLHGSDGPVNVFFSGMKKLDEAAGRFFVPSFWIAVVFPFVMLLLSRRGILSMGV